MSDKENLLRSLSEDRALASVVLFPHRHKDPTPPAHIEVMDLWRSDSEFTMVEAYRGFAKTSLMEEFHLTEALFQNFHYAVIISETYDKACQKLEAMKYELLTNPKLLALFGNQKSAVWNQNKVVLQNGTIIEVGGWEQEFRGFKHHADRPDRAILDDVENKETTRDSSAVDGTMRKLYTEIIPMMDVKRRRVRVVGSPLADDCMISRLRVSPSWKGLRFPICDRDIDDPDAVSAWPERYSIGWIRAERDRFAEEAQLRQFNQEYMLIAAGTQGKPFTVDMFEYQEIGPAVFAPRKLIMDPARTVHIKKSDETGYVVVSRIATRIYIWESGGEFWKPDQIVDAVFRLSVAHSAQAVLEKDALDEWLMQPVRKRMLDTGVTIDLVAVNAPKETDKTSFILGLQPYFAAHDIVFVGTHAKHAKLAAQILNFPSGKRDVINALAYALRVFSGVPVYSEFDQCHIVDEWEVGKKDVLMLAIHQQHQTTAAALVCVAGQRHIVLADWLSTLEPLDAIRDIYTIVRAIYPANPVRFCVTGDMFDQEQREPLMKALRSQRHPVIKGGYANVARGGLGSLLRTELERKRLFLVCRNASATLNALAGDYNYALRNGTEKAADPAPGVSRILMEAIECLTLAMTQEQNANHLPDGLNMGTNPQGVSYPTALPGRRAK